MPTLELHESEANHYFQSEDSDLMTEVEYLTTEPDRFERHEYIDGQVRTMADASDSHEGVATLLGFLIYGHLRGKPCRVYKGDMKLRVQQRTQAKKLVYYYPDIMVVCDPTDDGENHKTKPRLIIEIFSNDKGRDLIEKLAVYRDIETLEEYFVISQNVKRPEVTAFRRCTNFEPEIILEESFTMDSIGLPLTVKELYEF